MSAQVSLPQVECCHPASPYFPILKRESERFFVNWRQEESVKVVVLVAFIESRLKYMRLTSKISNATPGAIPIIRHSVNNLVLG